MAKYDLAISFAGEQRALAESLARQLDATGYSIFYDHFEAAELWGRDLSLKLGDVYAKEARFCLVLLSKEYVEKAWTNFERQNAISRFMEEKGNYILCLKIDDVHLPGLPHVIGYLDIRNYDEEAIYELLLQKLGKPNHDDYISRLSKNDQERAARIIKACYRRAIFTRMQREINIHAMQKSIGAALGIVQSLTPDIEDQALQYAARGIIQYLDAIERIKADAPMGMLLVSPDLAKEVDRLKVEVIRLLLEIRRAAKLPIQLPFALRYDHFFREDDLNIPL
ncbi:MAG: TIR domain-containing protein [Blastocatellia bacterium]